MKTLSTLVVFFLAVTPALQAQGLWMNAGDTYATQIPLTHSSIQPMFGNGAIFGVGADDFDNNDYVRFQLRLQPGDFFTIDTFLNPANPVVTWSPLSPGRVWGSEVRITVAQGSILLRGVSYQEWWDVGQGFASVSFGEVTVVPEASSIALVLLGLGTVGALFCKTWCHIRSRVHCG